MRKIVPQLVLTYFIFIIFSCTDKGKSTDTYSSIFSNKIEKIAFLKKYFKLRTEIKDAEYWILYQDNSNGVIPGPSYWKYQIALKLDKKHLNKWINGSLEVHTDELIDWTHILPATKYWSIKGHKRFFKNGFVWIEERNILLIHQSVN